MFGFSTARPDSDHRYNEEGEWYGEASGGAYSGQYQAMTQYHAMAQEAQPVHYQLTHCAQSGQYKAFTQVPVAHGVYPYQLTHGAVTQVPVAHGVYPYQLTHGAVTQVPVAHGTCPVQYYAMAQGAQPMPYQVMTQWVSGYVTSTTVVPAPQNVVNATRGVSDNVAAPFGQRALPPGQQKSRLQSLHKALFMMASEYYSLVMYIEVIDKLERRFGYRDLPETARVTFSSARQGDIELGNDPCKRTIYGLERRPASIEQAIDQLKWVFHTRFVYQPILVQKVAGVNGGGHEKMYVSFGKAHQKSIAISSQAAMFQLQRDRELISTVIIEQIKSDSMSQIDASVNGFAIQAVINTAAENTLASDRVVAQLPEKVPMWEQWPWGLRQLHKLKWQEDVDLSNVIKNHNRMGRHVTNARYGQLLCKIRSVVLQDTVSSCERYGQLKGRQCLRLCKIRSVVVQDTVSCRFYDRHLPRVCEMRSILWPTLLLVVLDGVVIDAVVLDVVGHIPAEKSEGPVRLPLWRHHGIAGMLKDDRPPPNEHYDLLKHVIRFLAIVACNEQVNKMSPMAMAMVCRPNLFMSGTGLIALRGKGTIKSPTALSPPKLSIIEPKECGEMTKLSWDPEKNAGNQSAYLDL
ncbi:hypothetical protein DPMN_111690 [Dreissena polymorpha]|uniref:Rho-GAP domain-containing protein n=1 Tax=Dreissena polymorpha TaxID=45954 RepID=A0A9D4KEB7_DREPO|nr:hypothetical protein DPMN_111690 [Dreissena polymorpha]